VLVGADHYHRDTGQVRVRAHRLQYGKPIHPGHEQVEQYQVGTLAMHASQGLLSLESLDQPIGPLGRLQHPPQQFHDLGIIVHN